MTAQMCDFCECCDFEGLTSGSSVVHSDIAAVSLE